jgi:hypothetical protein
MENVGSFTAMEISKNRYALANIYHKTKSVANHAKPAAPIRSLAGPTQTAQPAGGKNMTSQTSQFFARNRSIVVSYRFPRRRRSASRPIDPQNLAETAVFCGNRTILAVAGIENGPFNKDRENRPRANSLDFWAVQERNRETRPECSEAE